ncbi:YhfG family protein [Luteibacter aegosomatis]|uniref:YhfG family protein n=1 Tax=Luteibacter aegosomatis TaxID=2911537 RepID=UPI001FF924E2|nr:YhfG family protein [Luteibacter aegosomatis]UPG85235.1 YhfG family protein [Luteibacter aegosomatis]
MKSPSLKDKMAYYAKVRGVNYANSLRLEGFDVPQKGQRKVASSSVLPKKERARG